MVQVRSPYTFRDCILWKDALKVGRQDPMVFRGNYQEPVVLHLFQADVPKGFQLDQRHSDLLCHLIVLSTEGEIIGLLRTIPQEPCHRGIHWDMMAFFVNREEGALTNDGHSGCHQTISFLEGTGMPPLDIIVLGKDSHPVGVGAPEFPIACHDPEDLLLALIVHSTDPFIRSIRRHDFFTHLDMLDGDHAFFGVDHCISGEAPAYIARHNNGSDNIGHIHTIDGMDFLSTAFPQDLADVLNPFTEDVGSTCHSSKSNNRGASTTDTNGAIGEGMSLEEKGIQDTFQEIDPSFTAVRNDEIRIFCVFAGDLDVPVHNRGKLLYIVSLDIDTTSHTQHQTVHDPTEGTDRGINLAKGTVL